MKTVLVEVVTGANGSETIATLRELGELSNMKRLVLEVEEITPKNGYIGDYVWNEEKQSLEIKYTPDVTVETILEQMKVLKEKINRNTEAEVGLGIQITDIDLNLLEHIATT